MAAAVVIISAALIAVAVSHGIARFAVKRALMPDRPNGRSSHSKTTPRSGGLAIFGGLFLAATLFAAWSAIDRFPRDYAFFLGCAAAAWGFGAIDDFRPIGARLKLAAQIVVAVAFVALLEPVERAPSPLGGDIELGLAAFPLTVFWIVAVMNAFNFMDGVNGLAGACAIFVLSALGVASAGASGVEWAAPMLFLACAVFGYLPLNIRGRLFMGDAGSQFLGFAIGAFAVLAAHGGLEENVSPLFVPIAFMPFLFDVAFTLAHRIRRRRNILEAHREHLYQLLVRMGGSHQAVAALYLTLITLTTTAAIMATALDPRLQYAAACILAAAFVGPAVAIYRRAAAAGLFSDEVRLAKARPSAEDRSLPAAAE